MTAFGFACLIGVFLLTALVSVATGGTSLITVAAMSPRRAPLPPGQPARPVSLHLKFFLEFFICRWGQDFRRLAAKIRARCINAFEKLRHPDRYEDAR